jgi:hypothetical protein
MQAIALEEHIYSCCKKKMPKGPICFIYFNYPDDPKKEEFKPFCGCKDEERCTWERKPRRKKEDV